MTGESGERDSAVEKFIQMKVRQELGSNKNTLSDSVRKGHGLKGRMGRSL